MYGVIILIIQFVLPAIILTCSYWKILQKVREVEWLAAGSIPTSWRAKELGMGDRFLQVRVDWIVEEGSMLTSAQQVSYFFVTEPTLNPPSPSLGKAKEFHSQAQTAVRKRRVMYVLILMVVVFMGSWLPITIANILRDLSLVSSLRLQKSNQPRLMQTACVSL